MIDVKRNEEKYYVAINPQTNDVHSVHREGCPFMPDDSKRIYLGVFPSGKEAGEEGKKLFCKSNCCRFCSRESSMKSASHEPMPEMTSMQVQNSALLLSFLN